MRSYGVLMHISSLPSRFGIGDLGYAAHDFAALLHDMGASSWQVLPYNPTESFLGNSPYASPSAFAGSYLLISPELMVQDGWLSSAELASIPLPLGLNENPRQVNYPAVMAYKQALLQKVFALRQQQLVQHQAFLTFCEEHAYWLNDYARFTVIKELYPQSTWVDWPAPLKDRDPARLAALDADCAEQLSYVKFVQFLFFSQWAYLRTACARLGIALIGDIPMYVTHDSADVWANRAYFLLDTNGRCVEVAGVPPDYFSSTGQRWGNPVYQWDMLQQSDFIWWKQRLAHILLTVDTVRLDHFRGFCAFWAIPAEEETAIHGKWKAAPASAFWQSMRQAFPQLPFIAEDLGIITEDVRKLMHKLHLPGMHVLQFAFGSSDVSASSDIPFAHQQHAVVYTGTHDNMTTRQWVTEAQPEEIERVSAYTGRHVHYDSVVDVFFRLALASVAQQAILPVQDILWLGKEGRMNIPGTSVDNWEWRMLPEEAVPERFMYMRELAHLYGRLPA